MRSIEDPIIVIPNEINDEQEAEIAPVPEGILTFASQDEAIADFVMRFKSSFHANFYSMKGKTAITELIRRYPNISNVQFGKLLNVTEGTIRYWKNSVGNKRSFKLFLKN